MLKIHFLCVSVFLYPIIEFSSSGAKMHLLTSGEGCKSKCANIKMQISYWVAVPTRLKKNAVGILSSLQDGIYGHRA